MMKKIRLMRKEGKLLLGDCLEKMRGIPDNSIDSIVTDPPYGLSYGGTKGFAESVRNILFDIVLPDLYDTNTTGGRLGKFVGPLDSITFLDFMNRTLGEETRVAVPESTVDFQSYVTRQLEIKNATKPPVASTNSPLAGVGNSKSVEFCRDYILQLRPNGNTPLGNSQSSLFRQLGPGCFCVPIIIPSNSECSRFLGTLQPPSSSFLSDIVRFFNNPKSFAEGSAFVLTSSGAEVRTMLAFDMRRRTIELIPAHGTFKQDCLFQLSCAEPIRAGTRASGLPAKFEPCSFSFVGDTTDRTITFHFHKEILRMLHYTRKGFMGKGWDAEVPSVEVWEECLRVLKPGGFLLSFGGSRTHHRIWCSIEDAGFEIRDTLMWLYGSGFPKSLNVSKAIDKAEGAEREVVGSNVDGSLRNAEADTDTAKQWDGWGTALKPAFEPIILARKPLSEKTVAANVLRWGCGAINVDGCRVGIGTNDFKGKGGGGTHPRTPEQKVPYSGGYAERGAIDHSSGRWPANVILSHHPECVQRGVKKVKSGTAGIYSGKNQWFGSGPGFLDKEATYADSDGLETVEDWQCHPDCPVGMFPQTSTHSTGKNSPADYQTKSVFGAGYKSGAKPYEGNSGSAARFFYCAKASKRERNAGLEEEEDRVLARSCQAIAEAERGNTIERSGKAFNAARVVKNNHPTVKPLALMEYLVKLVTVNGGKVLDPYMGSGTTGVACRRLGMRFVGIELEEEYFKIARKRIRNHAKVVDGEKE